MAKVCSAMVAAWAPRMLVTSMFIDTHCVCQHALLLGRNEEGLLHKRMDLATVRIGPRLGRDGETPSGGDFPGVPGRAGGRVGNRVVVGECHRLAGRNRD